MRKAVFLTSMTTAIGLFSLNFSDAPPYRDLGTFAGIGGRGAADFIDVALPALGGWGGKAGPLTAKADRWNGWPIWYCQKTTAYAGHAGVTFIGASLLPRLTFNDRFVEYFDERVDFRQSQPTI